MKTIKLPIDASDYSSLENDERVYSSAVRFAFNRFQDGVAKKRMMFIESSFQRLGSVLIYSTAPKKKRKVSISVRERKRLFSEIW